MIKKEGFFIPNPSKSELFEYRSIKFVLKVEIKVCIMMEKKRFSDCQKMCKKSKVGTGYRKQEVLLFSSTRP